MTGKCWPEFIDALPRCHGLQNIVYADVGGVSTRSPGRIPIRKPENDMQACAGAEAGCLSW